MRWKRAIPLAAAATVAALALGPFLIPVGEASGTRPARELAGPEGRFLEFEGVDVHYRMAGRGGPPRIALHGFGASTFSFRDVFGPWAQRAVTLAYDRPAFGLTERPWPVAEGARSPYTAEFDLDLLRAVIDHAGGPPAVLIGHSAGARVAVEYALARPDDVAALVLISPAVSGGGPPLPVRLAAALPQVQRLGPRLLRWALPRFGQDGIDRAWHDPSRVTPAIRAGYALPLQADHWDHALWAFSRARSDAALEPRLAELATQRVLVVTGDDDRIVPTQDSVRFAEEIGAELRVVPDCGHLAHEECPNAWRAELEAFLGNHE